MKWTNNYSLLSLFNTHNLRLVNEVGEIVIIHIPSYREVLNESSYAFLFNFIDENKIEEMSQSLKHKTITTTIEMLMCNPEITNIKEFAPISNALRKGFKLVFPDFRVSDDRHIYFKDVPLDDDLWNEIRYVYSNGYGVQTEKMPEFANELARQIYLKSIAAKKKSRDIKNKSESSGDKTVHVFSLIAYKFPYTFEQILDMTIAQVNYLQSIASKMIAYENGMSAYTAGNMKKPPDFFLK